MLFQQFGRQVVFIDFIGVYRTNPTFDDVANLDRFQAIVQKSLARNDDVE